MKRLTRAIQERDSVSYLKSSEASIIQIIHNLGMYEDLEEKGLLFHLPCKIGDTVYRICPKCNEKHDGNCKGCAWEFSSGANGCDVYGLWSDGRFPAEKCTIVPYKVTWNYIPNLVEHLGMTVFLTEKEAKDCLKEQM